MARGPQRSSLVAAPAWLRPGQSSCAAQLPISIVVPARNEAPTIGPVLEVAARIGRQLLVIDGGSTDGTGEVARSYGAQVVTDPGRGKGLAVRTALPHLVEPITCLIDADGSHNPHDIARLVQPLLDDHYDLVIASRLTGGSDELHGDLNKFARLIGSAIITLGINYRFNVRLSDSQNGFRAIRTELLRSLPLVEEITTIEQEMLMAALARGARVGEIPSHEYARLNGTSVIRLREVSPAYVRSWLSGLLRR